MAGGKLDSKIIGLGLVVGILVFAGLLLRSLPWVDVFAKQDRETVLFVTEQVEQTGAFLVLFNFTELTVDVYPIPSDLSLEVLGDYGTYRFQAVYPLLALEDKDVNFIRSTISLSMGVLLDELWRADTPALQLDSSARLRVFLLQNFWHNQQISLRQKLAWLGLVWDRRTEAVVREPLTSLPSPSLRQANLIGTELACTVALVNTTSLNGLAGRIENLLENHHFRVVRTTSDDSAVERTTVISTAGLSNDCQQVFTKIERLVPGGVEEQQDDQQTQFYRADLVVRLGADLVQ